MQVPGTSKGVHPCYIYRTISTNVLRIYLALLRSIARTLASSSPCLIATELDDSPSDTILTHCADSHSSPHFSLAKPIHAYPFLLSLSTPLLYPTRGAAREKCGTAASDAASTLPPRTKLKSSLRTPNLSRFRQKSQPFSLNSCRLGNSHCRKWAPQSPCAP